MTFRIYRNSHHLGLDDSTNTNSTMSQQLEGIETPHDHDVLSGRGNFVNYHAGNEHFRALVRKYKLAYVACPKPQKGKFSKMIVDEIRALNPPGRFLKQDPTTKLWYDIGEKKSLDKTRQALREGAPEIMKEISSTNDDESGAEDSDERVSPQKSKSPSHHTPNTVSLLAAIRVCSFVGHRTAPEYYRK